MLFSPRLRTTIFAKRLHKRKVKRTFAVLIILEGVRIGRGAVVAAGALVREDVPAGMVAAGIPAKVIRARRLDGMLLPAKPVPLWSRLRNTWSKFMR